MPALPAASMHRTHIHSHTSQTSTFLHQLPVFNAVIHTHVSVESAALPGPVFQAGILSSHRLHEATHVLIEGSGSSGRGWGAVGVGDGVSHIGASVVSLHTEV